VPYRHHEIEDSVPRHTTIHPKTPPRDYAPAAFVPPADPDELPTYSANDRKDRRQHNHEVRDEARERWEVRSARDAEAAKRRAFALQRLRDELADPDSTICGFCLSPLSLPPKDPACAHVLGRRPARRLDNPEFADNGPLSDARCFPHGIKH
jgi:hypothetical protein